MKITPILMSIFFVVYVVLTVLLYTYAPLQTKDTDLYQTTSVAAAVFGGALLLGFVLISFGRKTVGAPRVTAPTLAGFAAKFAAVLGILGALVLVVWLLMSFTVNASATIATVTPILNILIAIVTAAAAMSYLGNTMRTTSQTVRLLWKVITYLPCVVINMVDYIREQLKITTKTTWIILAVDIALLLIQFLVSSPFGTTSKILYSGKVLLGNPQYLSKEAVVGKYEDLHQNLKKSNTTTEFPFKYSYGLSAWVYINPQPPNTSPAYGRYSNLLNYGGKPSISYRADENKLRIAVKLNDQTEQVIYATNELKLQKWNSIVVNYDAGTMDVFLNNELVATVQNVAPYMTMEDVVVGEDGGIQGGIKDVMYFEEPAGLTTINNIVKYQNEAGN
jgi:hypothetical protein